jgi:hypothetical protein
LWKKKRPLFVLAAACLGLAAVCPWARTAMDKSALAANAVGGRQASQIIDDARSLENRFEQVERDTGEEERTIQTFFELQKDKRVVAGVLALVHEALPTVVSAPTEGGSSAQCPQLLLDLLEVRYVSSKQQATESRGPLLDGWQEPWSDHRPGSQQHAEVPPQGPGFHVHLVGRLLGVEDRPAAATLLMDEYIPGLARLGSRAGLGFHVLRDTPDSQQRPSIELLDLRRHVQQIHNQGESQPDIPPRGEPPAPNPQIAGGAKWRFEISLRLELGEAADSED